MKFIVDQQLPPLLAAWLRDRGHEAAHTRELDQKTSPDRDIWASACATGAVVVSKDEDFVQLFTRSRGARLVWVRIGNCNNATLVARFALAWPTVLSALDDGSELVEVR